jgi:hypothetical protein
MTRDDLCEMLAEQTPACGPAREALLSGGALEVWEGLVPADQLFHTYRIRSRVTQRKGQPTIGLDETVGILQATGDELSPCRLDWDGRSGVDVRALSTVTEFPTSGGFGVR